MRVLTSLTKDQMRLGYLNCLVLVAGRQLDTHAGLLRRFEELVLRKITPEDSEFQEHMLLIVQQYEKQQNLWRVGQTRETDSWPPRHTGRPKPFYYLHELWLKHDAVSDATGAIAPGSCRQILKMARNMGLIGPTYALTEFGVLLRSLLLDMGRDFSDGRPELNPFHIWKRAGLALTFLYLLLSSDIVLPFLVELYAKDSIVSEQKGVMRKTATNNRGTITGEKDAVSERLSIDKNPERQATYLILALDKLIDGLSKHLPIDQTLLLKEVRQLRSRLEDHDRLKNHFYPRRQHLIDLGLLKRGQGAAAGDPLFARTLATQRASNAWRGLIENPLKQDSLIQRNFFRWSAEIYGFSARPAENDLCRLDYYARGFPLVGREIGFTPARTVALAGCLLAIEEGVIIEVDEMFRMMAEMAKGPYRPYLHYSGGSRLDREFLIRVDVDPLRERLRKDGLRPRISGGPRK